MDACRAKYERDGYTIVRGLFSQEEAEAYRRHYMELNEKGHGLRREVEGFDAADPLGKYPRLVQAHEWDETSRGFLLEPRIRECLVTLLGHEPYCAQTMMFYKPPGARGQGLHQDNSYLRVSPGSTHAAWLALDECDLENGCLRVVPGSQRESLSEYLTYDPHLEDLPHYFDAPPDLEAVPLLMEPGDVAFFHGNLIHGSFRNRTTDRYRRSLIAHYADGDTKSVASCLNPSYTFAGEAIHWEVESERAVAKPLQLREESVAVNGKQYWGDASL
jgi:ectoine hydroxylase-related dioxygenase (phytanoyl-CoA dioxygenase family)